MDLLTSPFAVCSLESCELESAFQQIHNDIGLLTGACIMYTMKRHTRAAPKKGSLVLEDENLNFIFD